MIAFDSGGSMKPTLRTFRGVWGSAHEMPIIVREDHRDGVATLSHWFVSSPPAHPLWPHYTFVCVHLRDVEGQSKPAAKRFPEATHEIMLLALNPELAPWDAETFLETMQAPRSVSAFLTPLNMSEQLRNTTDAQAIELTGLLARGMVDGVVPIEPQDWGGRARWQAVIASTMEHIQTGGHAHSEGTPL